MPYNLSQLRRQRSSLAGLNDVMDQQLNGIEGRLGVGQRPMLRDRMQQFDMRQAQQNALGRLQAGRQSQFGAMVPPDNVMLANRVKSALSGSPLAAVPPEQQSFVASQMRQPAPMMGQQQGLANYRPGLGNPYYDPAPQPPANQPNAYGLQAQRNFVPGAVAPVGQGVLGTVGNSTLQRIDGRNVLVGNRAEIPEGGLRAMQRAATETPEYKAQVQANADRLKSQLGPIRERQQAAREAAALRRGLPVKTQQEGGIGGLSLGPNGPATTRDGVPIPAAATGRPDADMMRRQRDREEGMSALNEALPAISSLMQSAGQGEIKSASSITPEKLLRVADSQEFNNFTPEGKKAMRAAVGHYLKANPRDSFGVGERYDELLAFAAGDEKKLGQLRKARKEALQLQNKVSLSMPR